MCALHQSGWVCFLYNPLGVSNLYYFDYIGQTVKLVFSVPRMMPSGLLKNIID